MPAIDVQVGNQEVDEPAEANATNKREQALSGENIDQTRQNRIAADVHAESEETAGDEFQPLARVRLLPPLAEGDASIEPPVPTCLLYTSPSPRDRTRSRMPSSA